MKRNILSVIILLLFSTFLLANPNQINLTIYGGGYNNTGFFNTFKAASIDVDNPNNQPIIFNMMINRATQQTIQTANIYYSLTWNNIVIIDATHHCPLKQTAITMLNNGQTIQASNRDLINENGSSLLGASDPSISLSELLSNSNFDSAIRNTGLFPDGEYVFRMRIEDDNGNFLSEQAEFTMTIQNVNNINLITPGTLAGGEIPNISNRPVLFTWISNISNINANKYKLSIREYSQLTTMDFSNLANTGSNFFEIDNLVNPLFNQNLPFMENNYYAWRISVPLVTDQTEFGQPSSIESPWYVFKFTSASTAPAPNPYQDFLNALQGLQNPNLLQFINQGYLPTGKVLLNGNNISPAQALQLLPQIINSGNVTIEIVD